MYFQGVVFQDVSDGFGRFKTAKKVPQFKESLRRGPRVFFRSVDSIHFKVF